jgi:hypothetical protein
MYVQVGHLVVVLSGIATFTAPIGVTDLVLEHHSIHGTHI